ncbi:MAG TPA: hypothetical protein VGF55_06905 [Gemmataceae bacterium]|jgi:hypothetical protein
MTSANDTLLLDAPVVRGSAATRTPDRTAALARVVRHALRAGAADTPLDRLIRSAARSAGGPAVTDVDARALLVARRMNAVLARRAGPPPVDPHRETVRGS